MNSRCLRGSLCLLLVASAFATGGCAFDRKWRAMKRADLRAVGPAAPAEAPAPDALAGRWTGKWRSDANGHTGGLRAIVTRVDDTTYRADFDASYMAVLRFGYTMTLTAAEQPDGTVSFQGREDLGALAGGMYEYDGRADGTAFHATYESGSDRGVFEMKRPPRAK